MSVARLTSLVLRHSNRLIPGPPASSAEQTAVFSRKSHRCPESRYGPAVALSYGMVNRFLLAAALIAFTMPAFAQDRALSAAPAQQADYVIGAQDVLVITSYDQPELTGKFTVETDGSFSYPMIGRVQVGGRTLRDIETAIRARLVEQGLFKAPEITVSIESYRSQKIYVVGEVRTPGAYPMSGNMRLVEALALAGSTQPTASGEAVIVRGTASGVVEGTKGIP